MYLLTFEASEDRQAAWDSILSSSAATTAMRRLARQTEVVQDYIDENPSITAPIGTILTSTLQELLSFGIDSVFANKILNYSAYLVDLTNAGVGSFLFVAPNGPYQVGISQAGNMIGGNGVDNTLVGTAGDDVMNGQGGDDTFIGGNGSDRFHGGSGDDSVDYSFDSSGIIIQLGALQGGTADEWVAINEGSVIQRIQDGEGNWDFAIAVEEIIGTAHDDRVSFYGSADDFFFADDVDTILQGGGNTALGDLLDFSAMSGVQGGLNIIWNSSGAINFNMGSWAAAGVAEGFEAVIGSTGDDYVVGGDGADPISGHFGADSLFGGDGDDFIFFDAEDTVVNGGAGRDVAVALGNTGVTVNMLEQELEVCIGGGGADTFIMGGSDDILFAAGGGGSDTFVIDCDEYFESPRVIWGGAEADNFLFTGDYAGGGIAVVQIDGLTEEMFANLTVEDLNLGGLNLDAFRAIIINPDASDRFEVGGDEFSASEMPEGVEWRFFSSPSLTDWIGRSMNVWGGYASNYEFEATLHVERDEFENVLSITDYTGRWLSDGSEEFNFYEYDPNDEGEQDEAEAFIEARAIEPLFRMTELETNPNYGPWYGTFFVVGGNFVGSSLGSNGELTGSLPDDTAPSPFDWLVAA